MLPKLYSVRPSAWCMLALLAALAVVSAFARSAGFVPSNIFMYGVQPVAALAIAGAAYAFARHKRPLTTHGGGRAFLVGGVFAIWFALYFLAGLISTYVHNSLFTGAKGLAVNLWQFGLAAAALEYSRYNLMKLVGRRNMLWFGCMLSCVLAVEQMNFGQLAHVHNLADCIKLGIADFVPSIFSSFTLTYLAITSGLAAQLMYRLGLVGIFVLLPIVPKFDWYLQGTSLVLLAVIIYVALDRETQADVQHPYRQRNQHRVFDVLWITGILTLVCFMIGVFSYRPYAIPTYSMAPTYSRGAMVVVQKIHNPMDVRVGDIVQYKTTNKLVTHRVLAIDAAEDGSGKRVFTIQGDHNPTPDAPVSQNQVVGIVRAHVPYLGYPTVWLMELSQGGR